MGDFTPSTVPGCRMPHLWLRDGRSLYDALGPDYTLLRFDPALEVGESLAAAGDRGVPLALLDVESARAAEVYTWRWCWRAPISTSPGAATPAGQCAGAGRA